jgi:uncharacterized protein (UPF0332 family)
MKFDDWLKDGSIKPFGPSKTQIRDLLASADKDIHAATEVSKLGYYGLSRDTAYEAMLKAGMALMYLHGYRPEAGSHHLTIVRFAERVLGSKHEDMVSSFDRFRRSRHRRLYQGKETATKSQSEKAIDTARYLLETIRKRVG